MTYKEALKIMGLSDGYTDDQLKKAYRKLAKKFHPDLGGTEDDMKRVNEAKELLEKTLESGEIPKDNNFRQSSNSGRSTGYGAGTGGSGGYGSGYNSWSDEYFRGHAGRYRAEQDYNRRYQDYYRNSNYEYKEEPTTGSKTAKGDFTSCEFDEIHKTINKMFSEMMRSASGKRIMMAIAKVGASVLLTVLILVGCELFIGEAFKSGNTFSIISSYIIRCLVIVYVIVHSIKSIILNKTDKIPDDEFINLRFDMDNSGTFVTISYNGKRKRLKISSVDYSGSWDSICMSWLEIAKSGFVCCTRDKVENLIVNSLNYCTSGLGTEFEGIKTNIKCCMIDSLNIEEYILIIPGGFLCVSDKSMEFIPMDESDLVVSKGKIQINMMGRKYNQSIHKITITSKYKQKFEVAFSKSTPSWTNLVI